MESWSASGRTFRGLRRLPQTVGVLLWHLRSDCSGTPITGSTAMLRDSRAVSLISQGEARYASHSLSEYERTLRSRPCAGYGTAGGR